MIKRLLTFILVFVFTLNIAFLNARAYSTKAYCLYDPILKKVISSSNMNQRMAMASTTKIMTAFIACELCDFDEIIEVKSEMIAVEGSSIGIQVGDKISIRCLLYGLMLESGNDAALCLATAISGSSKSFSVLMNEKAKLIGLENTSFVTPNGLDDKNHYSTAFDMAKLTGYAMQNADFSEIVATKTYKAVYNGGETTRTYYNHNRLLNSLDGADGVKTGFTKKAGRCLVSSCKRNGIRLIAVTLNASDDWNDHRQLYSYGFKQYQKVTLPVYNKYISVSGGKKSRVEICSEATEIYFYKGLSSYIKIKPYIPRFLYAPVNKYSKIGYIEYRYNKSVILTAEVYPIESVKYKYSKSNFKKSFTALFLSMLGYI